MLLAKFDPPAFLDDLDEAQKSAWSDFISDQIDSNISDYTGNHFYNPTKMDTGDDVQTAEISWTGFPRNVTIDQPSDQARWVAADGSRNLQDEYLEWSVTRHPDTNKITRVTFTCEGPEYWQFLASVNPDKVLELYRKFINEIVREEDLFTSTGIYRPQNKWNNSTTRGAMHLVQRANTLGAEINIAVRATIIRNINGTILTGERELIDCGRYGDRERFSDPHIGAEINSLARQDAFITLANPLALYIADLDTAGWETPDGSNPKLFWTIVRGSQEHAVRAVYEVPSDKGFTVSDIKINGEPISFGAQIADFITIKIIGQAFGFGKNSIPALTQCEGVTALAGVKSVLDAIKRTVMSNTR
jgi:hypothetical protein